MANVVTKHGLTIEIKGDGVNAIDADWTYTDTLTNATGVPLSSIQFNPAAANDKCVIKEGNENAVVIFEALCENQYDQKVKYFHGENKHPFLDVGDGTFTAGAKIIIELSEISG